MAIVLTTGATLHRKSKSRLVRSLAHRERDGGLRAGNPLTTIPSRRYLSFTGGISIPGMTGPLVKGRGKQKV